MSKRDNLQFLRDMLTYTTVRTQAEIVENFVEFGQGKVTQATVSRYLKVLGAFKTYDSNGLPVWGLPTLERYAKKAKNIR